MCEEQGRVIQGIATVQAQAVAHVSGYRIGYLLEFDRATRGAERVAAVLDYIGNLAFPWWDLLRAASVVEAFYSGSPIGNTASDAAVVLGCVASQVLEEHLIAACHAVEGWRNQDQGDAIDVANTYKHAGDDPERRFGVILEHVNGEQNRVTLVFAKLGDADVTTRDALEVLSGCIQRWERIAGELGIDLPPLPVSHKPQGSVEPLGRIPGRALLVSNSRKFGPAPSRS